MVAWKVVLFPLLLAAAGFVWIMISAVLNGIVPVINEFITNGMLSVQTAEAVNFGLTVFSALPGVVMLCFGIGMIVDVVYRGDDY